MNKIEGILDTSDYGYWDYINFKIDGYWLDEKLEELYPNNMYKGLIPTLVEWMESEEEKRIVWERILPKENSISISPILMCPDDNDFSCTIIVAEIINRGNIISWLRIGIDKTKEWGAEKIGSNVDWFDKIGNLNFNISEYTTMLQNFKDRMEFDKVRMINND